MANLPAAVSGEESPRQKLQEGSLAAKVAMRESTNEINGHFSLKKASKDLMKKKELTFGTSESSMFRTARHKALLQHRRELRGED